MASIILGNIAASAGVAAAGPIGGAIGYSIGSTFGGIIDNKIASGRSVRRGARLNLAELNIQTSTYGKMLPIVYGECRLAGNVIWASKIKESEQISRHKVRLGKGSSRKHTEISYNYSISLAIAICEGPIDEVSKIFVNGEIIDRDKYQINYHLGEEEQGPDSFIETIEGIGKTPAYRGIAYVTLIDFPISGSIPNFTFEVRRKVTNLPGKKSVEELVRSMVIIPGSGEFVYDPEIVCKANSLGGQQMGPKKTINVNNHHFTADSNLALKDLAQTCPEVEWVAPVVAWFTDSLNIADNIIQPKVEYKNAVNSPDDWQVADYSRDSAPLMRRDQENRPIYGGTINDKSLQRFLKKLKQQYKVMLNPMILVDNEYKSWRGRMTGEANRVDEFFNRQEGYRDFILHYAHLAKGLVDGFLIGSELIGITTIQDENNNFPAVQELIKLAKEVREILGKEVVISYAADWSEYHHSEGGWYHLDELWAAPEIDVVAIDAYFPLTEAEHSVYNLEEIMQGWHKGENYDFYYQDGKKIPLSPAYACKNIAWWWENEHYNPDGKKSPWQPKSKKIWFTEYGFPSVDLCTNQPNVFYDPSSIESALPRHSRGIVDFRAQRRAIEATELYWQNSEMVENKFLWCWDARPFPSWPSSHNIWSDGALWPSGHWVSGKFGMSSLAAIIYDLCKRAGFSIEELDLSDINDSVEGYVITEMQTIRSALEILQSAYFFDSVETEGKLKFITRGQNIMLTIGSDELMEKPLITIHQQEMDLPKEINIMYLSKNYEQMIQIARRQSVKSQEREAISLPLVLSHERAKEIAEISLYNAWLEQNMYKFYLSSQYLALEPGDIINLANKTLRINKVTIGQNNLLEVNATEEDKDIYIPVATGSLATSDIDYHSAPGETKLHIFQLEDNILYLAACGLSDSWRGASIYRKFSPDSDYEHIATIERGATMGYSINELADEDSLEIVLLHGQLETKNEYDLLAGVNTALIGEEIIQFQYVEMIAPYHYILSGLKRKRVIHHAAGEIFILLDDKLEKFSFPNQWIGQKHYFSPVSHGGELQPELAYQYQKFIVPAEINQ